MNKSHLHHSAILGSLIFAVLLCGLLYSSNSHATTTNSLAGSQLAYFVGYHSGGMHKGYYNPGYGHHYGYGHVYYKPQYHYRGSYRTPWTYIGHNCRKTCWIDRWTGRSLNCYKTC